MAAPNLARLFAVLVSVTAAATFWGINRIQRQRGRTPLVLSTEDGLLHVAEIGLASRPDRALRILRSFPSSGNGAMNWELPQVTLAPHARTMVAFEIEFVSDAIDFRVTLYDVASGAALFSATDNSMPDVEFRGDDPDAPAELIAGQAEQDRLWEEDRLIDPTIPRPIVSGRFFEVPNESIVGASGWTPTGDLLVSGACPLQLSTGHLTGPVPWWGLVAPHDSGSWRFVRREVGAIPADIAFQPRPRSVSGVALGGEIGARGGRIITVDGHGQRAAALNPGVISFDGPFKR